MSIRKLSSGRMSLLTVSHKADTLSSNISFVLKGSLPSWVPSGMRLEFSVTRSPVT
jgi:hypothetical protein